MTAVKVVFARFFEGGVRGGKEQIWGKLALHGHVPDFACS